MKLILILLCSISVSAYAADAAKKADTKATPAAKKADAKAPAKPAAAKPVAKTAAKPSRAPVSVTEKKDSKGEVQFASEKVGSTTVVCGYLKSGNAISCVNAK